MKTITFTPTWESLLPYLLRILQDGETADSRRYAMEELQRMARLADMYVEAEKALEAVRG